MSQDVLNVQGLSSDFNQLLGHHFEKHHANFVMMFQALAQKHKMEFELHQRQLEYRWQQQLNLNDFKYQQLVLHITQENSKTLAKMLHNYKEEINLSLKEQTAAIQEDFKNRNAQQTQYYALQQASMMKKHVDDLLNTACRNWSNSYAAFEFQLSGDLESLFSCLGQNATGIAQAVIKLFTMKQNVVTIRKVDDNAVLEVCVEEKSSARSLLMEYVSGKFMSDLSKLVAIDSLQLVDSRPISKNFGSNQTDTDPKQCSCRNEANNPVGNVRLSVDRGLWNVEPPSGLNIKDVAIDSSSLPTPPPEEVIQHQLCPDEQPEVNVAKKEASFQHPTKSALDKVLSSSESSNTDSSSQSEDETDARSTNSQELEKLNLLTQCLKSGQMHINVLFLRALSECKLSFASVREFHACLSNDKRFLVHDGWVDINAAETDIGTSKVA